MKLSLVILVVIVACVCIHQTNAADDDRLVSTPKKPGKLVSLTLDQVEAERKQILEERERQKHGNERVRRADGRPYLPRPTPPRPIY